MLGNNHEYTEQVNQAEVHQKMELSHLSMEQDELGLEEEHVQAAASMLQHQKILATGGEVTPMGGFSRSSSHANMDSASSSAAKRRGRPRGWTDARIHNMLTYLERNMAAWKGGNLVEFYSDLCTYLQLDPSEAMDIHEKCEKMIKKYESDRRRGDASWKWFARLNQVFDGPAITGYNLVAGRHPDDDAASSSMDSSDEDNGEAELDSLLIKKPRGEDPFQDRLEHEKLLLKLKRLKSKTEMRHRDFEAAAAKQMAAFDELKGKTTHAIARLEKSIINAGYLLDQAEEMMVVSGAEAHHHQISAEQI